MKVKIKSFSEFDLVLKSMEGKELEAKYTKQGFLEIRFCDYSVVIRNLALVEFIEGDVE